MLRFLFTLTLFLSIGSCIPAKMGTTTIVPVSIDDGLGKITASNAASFTVKGKCSNPDQRVHVTVGGVEVPGKVPCLKEKVWGVEIDVTSLHKKKSIEIIAKHPYGKGNKEIAQAKKTVPNSFNCPEQHGRDVDIYVPVPSSGGKNKESFCIQKYEAKKSQDNKAVSKPEGSPYLAISVMDATSRCQRKGPGHDLITNEEWQITARNLEKVPENWGDGIVGSQKGLKRGHSDNIPNRTLVAASDDDSEGCYGTGQSCSDGGWDDQSRVMTLSNGQKLWDFSGNISEFVQSFLNPYPLTASKRKDLHIAQLPHSLTETYFIMEGREVQKKSLKDLFGPSGDYSSLNSSPYGGLGHALLKSFAGVGMRRGGDWESGDKSGIFSVNLQLKLAWMVSHVGFRCVFHPPR